MGYRSTMRIQTSDQIKEHYEIEKGIARRLRNSTTEERANLYTWAYDELFRQVPHHPMLADEEINEHKTRSIKEIASLQPFVKKESVFLEIGPGDCAVSLEIAKQVNQVYAIDVSTEITKKLNAPANFNLILSDGSSIPLPPETIDVAYSNQLMEHLHPDDSLKQLQNVYRTLKPGGIYFCVTPNRLSGPHDISRTFDPVATGLHLKEYTVSEMDRIFKETEFSSTRIYVRFGEYFVFLPTFLFKFVEQLIEPLPHSVRKLLTFNRIVKFLLGIKIVGKK